MHVCFINQALEHKQLPNLTHVLDKIIQHILQWKEKKKNAIHLLEDENVLIFKCIVFLVCDALLRYIDRGEDWPCVFDRGEDMRWPCLTSVFLTNRRVEGLLL